MIDALVELHAFDWRGTAIEEMAKPDQLPGTAGAALVVATGDAYRIP